MVLIQSCPTLTIKFISHNVHVCHFNKVGSQPYFFTWVDTDKLDGVPFVPVPPRQLVCEEYLEEF